VVVDLAAVGAAAAWALFFVLLVDMESKRSATVRKRDLWMDWEVNGKKFLINGRKNEDTFGIRKS